MEERVYFDLWFQEDKSPLWEEGMAAIMEAGTESSILISFFKMFY